MGGAEEVQRRCRGGAEEVQWRCSGGAVEVQRRCRGGADLRGAHGRVESDGGAREERAELALKAEQMHERQGGGGA